MWPFSKKENKKTIHPLAEQFSTLLVDPIVLEWFERVVQGWNMGLPATVGFKVQEAINLSYTITSMTGLNSSQLLDAAKNKDFANINDKLNHHKKQLHEFAVDNSMSFSRIIQWADDHKIPNLKDWDALFYKQCGLPRDIESLINLRFLLVMEDHGITEIPPEICKLPMLQGLCISNNQISTIPIELYKCHSLKRVDLENNLITRIEDGIHNLKNVSAIDLSGNKLSYVTPDIAKMSSLNKLDIRKQKTSIDMMRAIDTPLSDESLEALYSLDRRIDVKY